MRQRRRVYACFLAEDDDICYATARLLTTLWEDPRALAAVRETFLPVFLEFVESDATPLRAHIFGQLGRIVHRSYAPGDGPHCPGWSWLESEQLRKSACSSLAASSRLQI